MSTRSQIAAASGEWVTITEAAAKPVAAGGANLEFTPVIAKAVRLIPVEWYTTDWAGAAEWQVYGVASDAKDTYVITWTDGTTTVTTTVEDGAMPLPPTEIGSYTEGNTRYTLIGWEPAITAATDGYFSASTALSPASCPNENVLRSG